MKRTALVVILISAALSVPALGGAVRPDKKDKQPAPTPAPKLVQAFRAEEPITIDGRLEENSWKREGSNGFLQNDPDDGKPATEKTDVWVAYDDKAFYVAAFCRDSNPKGIVSRLGRRDDQLDSDWFMVAVDPYFDKRSGYLFGINPAGSIMDEVLSNDVQEDLSWDGVWEAKATRTDEGWTVEMRIPFNQIRFPKKDDYTWGINFHRRIMRKNERASFAWVAKNETAYVSRFARLEGIKGISPGTHIEFMPYVTGQGQLRPAEAGNPFETGRRLRGNAGFDLKVGLKSNLTLDATVNPDFGQVEVDPAVVNLSAYETFYEEKRPFFIEGASIFDDFGRGGIYLNAGMNWPAPQFFYSRRVGRAPQGYATGDGYVDSPDRSTILGAAKVTGKLGGWNVGFINALTGREFARIDSFGLRTREEVEPMTYSGVLRAQKDFNEGQQGIGIMATGITRDLRGDALSGILNRNAFSLGLDGWSFLDKKRAYVIGGWFGGTRVEGSAQDILRLQSSSVHYFQRPDATHVEVDPTATSLSGWGGRIQFAKQNGPLLWVLGVGALSPGFNPNDAGYQRSGSDVVNFSFLPGYMWTKPGKVFQQFLVALGGLQNYDFGGSKVAEAAVLIGQGVFRNFWSFNTEIVLASETLSNRLTRGGPLAISPAGTEVGVMLETDGRKAFVLEGRGSISDSRKSGGGWSTQLTLRWKPSSNLSLSVGPMYMVEDSEAQWVGRFRDPAAASTFGSRYVFGRIHQQIVSAEVRVNWTFSPTLSLQAYLQPFIGVGRYDRFKELARPRTYEFLAYGQGGTSLAYDDGSYFVQPGGDGAPFAFGNPDFNVKSLRGTVVLRWEYLPGSLLYFVWTQNRADYANPGELRLRRDMADLLTAPGDNIFMLKASYRWNM